jgi:hypothetical protein
MPNGNQLVQSFQRKDVVSPYGNFTVTARRKKAMNKYPAISKELEFAATVQARVDHPLFQGCLTLSFHQRAVQGGYQALYPTISVGRVWPLNSPIFKSISDGDMPAFMSLLRNGKATVWDRDECGSPLLHVSSLACTCL